MMRREVNFLHEVSRDAIEFVEAGGDIQRLSVAAALLHPRWSSTCAIRCCERREVRVAINEALDRNELVRNAHARARADCRRPVLALSLGLPAAAVIPVALQPGGREAPARGGRACSVSTGSARQMPRAVPRSRASSSPATTGSSASRCVVQRQLYAVGIDMDIEPLPPQQDLQPRLDSGRLRGVHLRGSRAAGRSSWAVSLLALARAGPADASDDRLLGRRRRPRSAAGRQVRRGGSRGAVRRACTSCATTRRPSFLAWPREARAADVAFDIPYETDRDVFGTLWRLNRAERSGQGASDEAHHVPIRAADRDRGGRCRSSSTASSRSAACRRARETSVSEGNLRGRRTGRQPAEAVHRQQRPHPALGRSGAQRHVPRAVAADPHPHAITSSSSRSSASSRCSTPAAGRIATSRFGGSRDQVCRRRATARRRASTSRPCSSTTTRCRPRISRCDWSGRRPGLAGRPALARGAVAVRRHASASASEGYALVFAEPPAHRPRQPGQEAARRAGRSGPGQPAAGGRRPGRRARVRGDVRTRSTSTTSHGRSLAARRPRAGPELDGDGRAADQRSVRGVATSSSAQLLAAIGLALLGTVVVGWVWARGRSSRASSRSPRATRAIAEGRLDERVAIGGQRRDPPARRLVQLDGRSPRRAAGGRQEAGTAGDVRPHRRRPGPRSVASDPEHRQQLQADRQKMFDDRDTARRSSGRSSARW